jgi:large subunit ribosomal protein L33
MAKAEARDYVSLECSDCGSRNYRTSKRIKGATYKVNLKKYCRYCRKHTLHKEKRK